MTRDTTEGGRLEPWLRPLISNFQCFEKHAKLTVKCNVKKNSIKVLKYIYIYLTYDNKDKESGGHSCCNVEHNTNVVSQLINVFHIGHQDRWYQEPNGNAQL